MLRGLVNVASTFSLLLALALAATWLVALHSSQRFEFTHRDITLRLSIAAGHFLLDNEPQRRLETQAFCRRLRERERHTTATLRILLEEAARRQALRVAALAPDERLYASVGRNRALEADVLARQLVLARRALNNPPPPKTAVTRYAVSFISLLAVASLLPALRLSLYLFTLSRRRSLRKQNRCPHCSYDLRATPTLCPECGTEFPANLSPPPT